MKNSCLIIPFALMALASCQSTSDDALVLERPSIRAAIQLEEALGSVPLESDSSSALPWKFLPVDSQFVMTRPIKFKRAQFQSLPMSTRMYSDSLGNEIIIYEWDLVTDELEFEEVNKLKESFDDQHAIYVGKYNQLLAEITQRIGEPMVKEEGLKKHQMEVYKHWTIVSKWQTDRQHVELKLLLVPKEVYRVILKNFVFAS